MTMHPFKLIRNTDVTGVSGTGKVAQGCVMTSGKVLMSWNSETPSGTVHQSLEAAHFIHSHGGASEFNFNPQGNPKVYHLSHKENRSGLSGVGIVAEVVEFLNGWVAIQWLFQPYQIEFFSSMNHFNTVHLQDYCQLTPVTVTWAPPLISKNAPTVTEENMEGYGSGDSLREKTMRRYRIITNGNIFKVQRLGFFWIWRTVDTFNNEKTALGAFKEFVDDDLKTQAWNEWRVL